MNFSSFVKAMHQQVAAMLVTNPRLYVTDIAPEGVWQTYLIAFGNDDPVFRKRNSHDCSCCRQFIKRFGNVVGIDPTTGLLLTIWDHTVLGEPVYQRVAQTLSNLVRSGNVIDVFLNDTKRLGTSHNFGQVDGEAQQFNHFYVDLPPALVAKRDQIDTITGRLRTQRETLSRALDTLTGDAVDTVLDLIRTNNLYRGAEHKEAVESFKRLRDKYHTFPDKAMFPWLNCDHRSHSLRNSAIGSLLVDLSEGRDLESAVKAFEDKVAPSNYKRPTALVTAKMVENARTKIAELGLTDSLQRRQAVLDDVSINNVLFADRSISRRMQDSDPFNVPTKNTPKSFDKARTVSIGDFISNVLPTATHVELLFENKHRANLVTLVTAMHKDAPPLFRWNNPFSWSYIGDVADSDLRRAVQERGGRVDGAFRFSHSWNHPGKRNTSLMDLHVFMPGHKGERGHSHTGYGNVERIGWNRRDHAASGGTQDVDYTAPAPADYVPVENITFPTLARMPDGEYRCAIHNWSFRTPTTSGFHAEIEFGGNVYEYVYDKAMKNDEWVEVATVTKRGSSLTIEHTLKPQSAVQKLWNIDTGDFRRVNAVMHSPNHWDGERGHGNEHVFFMLADCVSDEDARGFYNEFLRPELNEHRKVLELVGGKQRVESVANQLSGVGFSTTSGAAVIVRVTGQSVSQILKVQF
jgi:hypothetical protein